MNQLDRPAAFISGRRIQVRSWEGQTRQKDDTLQVPGRRRSLSSTSKRRSVLSMRGLMPLALSPACSIASSSPALSERLGNEMDGYFPNMMVNEMDRSTTAFTTHKLSPETHEPTISYQEKGPLVSSGWANRFHITSPYLAVSGPVRSLGPIQERNSVVSFIDHQEPKLEELTDGDSMSGTETSRFATVASLSFRDQSIMTTATSMSSSSWATSPRNSPQHSPSCLMRGEHSWIDNDSEDEDEDEPADITDDNIAPLSPRPPTPPESDSSNGPSHDLSTPSYKQHFHRKSHSTTRSVARSIAGSVASSSFQGRISIHRSESAAAIHRPPTSQSSQRGSSLSRSHSSTRQPVRPRAASMQTPRNSQRSSVSRTRTSTTIPQLRQDPNQLSESIYGDDSDDESLFHDQKSPVQGVYIRPSPPPSPMPSVQYWLNGSAHPYGSQGQCDDLAKAVPLPPNVVETLRVSIACFPETMLLTSSLTVETIRNYSRKVRQPSAELLSNLAPDSPSDSPRKSIWKRVVNYTRSPSVQSDRRRPESPSSIGRGNFRSPSTSSLAPPKPWQPLKNVFGCASDYICDALWAHIVAYNYISAVVPRGPPPRTPAPPPTRHGRSSTSNDNSSANNGNNSSSSTTGSSNNNNSNNKEEIPKKAAHLLGLADAPGMDRIARKLGSWRQGMITEQSAKSVNYDNATRDIQAGLMRCIMRLIATAKLMAEDGEAEDKVVEVETPEVDILFTRGLCEIVRISEEASLS